MRVSLQRGGRNSHRKEQNSEEKRAETPNLSGLGLEKTVDAGQAQKRDE